MNIKELKKLKQTTQNTDSVFTQLSELLQKDIKLFSSFGIKDKERYYTEVGMLLSAGVDLKAALELSAMGALKNKKLHGIYQHILEKVVDGTSLGDAMLSTGKFNNFDCYSITIGENTGELNKIFDKLSKYYTRQIAQRRKITGALSYPLIILITTTCAVMFMLRFVVPMFAQTLQQFGGELPAITRIVIYLSDNISRYFLIIAVTVGLAGSYLYRNRHKESIRGIMANILLKLPFWGKLMRKVHLAQFAESMSLLMAAKVTIYDSLELTEKMTRFYPIKMAVAKAMKGLTEGKTLHDCIKNESIFDHKIIALVKIGEEINQLDTIFAQLSIQMQQEIDYQSSVLISILEPLMILFLALIIGVILIAMYLPMFKLGSVIN